MLSEYHKCYVFSCYTLLALGRTPAYLGILESTETNLENPETHVVLFEKELQEDDSGNWASAGDAARNPGPTIGKGREARAVRQRDTNKQAAALIFHCFLIAAFCERVSGCCPAPTLPKVSTSGQALAMTLHRQAGQKLLGVLR